MRDSTEFAPTGRRLRSTFDAQAGGAEDHNGVSQVHRFPVIGAMDRSFPDTQRGIAGKVSAFATNGNAPSVPPPGAGGLPDYALTAAGNCEAR